MSSKTVLKLNNIPHGFYEDQMKKYFSQFGKIKNAVVIRSKKTHKSRGFGFVECADPRVAKAAADAMHNYIMFNQVLKCRLMDKEDLPKNLFRLRFTGPTSVEKSKRLHNKAIRDPRTLKAHYRKILKTEYILLKLGVQLSCHIINKPTH